MCGTPDVDGLSVSLATEDCLKGCRYWRRLFRLRFGLLFGLLFGSLGFPRLLGFFMTVHHGHKACLELVDLDREFHFAAIKSQVC